MILTNPFLEIQEFESGQFESQLERIKRTTKKTKLLKNKVIQNISLQNSKIRL